MGSSEQELDEILAVMRAVPGVSGVCKSAYTGPDLNKMNVFFRYQPPGGGAKVPVRVPCSADLPDKLAAAKIARDKVITIFGEETVAKAEKQVRETAAIGSSMASPSLAPAAEASAASASASGDAFAIIGRTQQLQGELRAAQLRAARALEAVHAAEAAHDHANEQLEQAQEALDVHQKRQKTAVEQAHPHHRPKHTACARARRIPN